MEIEIMTDDKYDLLETTDDFPEEIISFNNRFCTDPRADEVLLNLRQRGMDDREIAIAFRLIAGIPREWKSEREPKGQAAKRRKALAEKLRKLANEVETDPDLSGLCFGINTIAYGTAAEDRDGLTTLAECIREGSAELKLCLPPENSSANDDPGIQRSVAERTITLKKFSIKEIFRLIDKQKKRAPNKAIAVLTSVLLGEKVTANDVTQARKMQRRKYYCE